MDKLAAISGELIRVPPDAVPVSRRRLLVERPADSAQHFAVKIISLHAGGCAISGPRALAELDGRLWLKLPGFEAIQLAATTEEEGRVLCWFAQPLHSAMMQAIVNPRSQIAGHSSCRPRCTFL
jgi:hypothetical protein